MPLQLSWAQSTVSAALGDGQLSYYFLCSGQPYPTPCLQRRELDSLSDYSFYVRNFLTRAALHAARSTKALY